MRKLGSQTFHCVCAFVCWHLTVALLCISLVTSSIEHLMCLFICTSFFVRCLCNLLPFLIGFLIFLILRWKHRIIHSYKMNGYKLLSCEWLFYLAYKNTLKRKISRAKLVTLLQSSRSLPSN